MPREAWWRWILVRTSFWDEILQRFIAKVKGSCRWWRWRKKGNHLTYILEMYLSISPWWKIPIPFNLHEPNTCQATAKQCLLVPLLPRCRWMVCTLQTVYAPRIRWFGETESSYLQVCSSTGDNIQFSMMAVDDLISILPGGYVSDQ